MIGTRHRLSAATIQRAYTSTRSGKSPNGLVLSVGIVPAEIAVVLVLILILILILVS
jgi:hypothetical protein